MNTGFATLLITATLALPQYSFAAVKPPVVQAIQAQSEDDASRLILVRRYFDAIQFDKIMNGMLEGQLDALIAQGRIPADRQSIFREAATATYSVVIPRMVEESMQVYAEAFTTNELEQLVAFYESPVGRSMTAKTVVLTQNTGEIMQRYGPQMEAEMLRQLCNRIDCKAEGLTR